MRIEVALRDALRVRSPLEAMPRGDGTFADGGRSERQSSGARIRHFHRRDGAS